MAACKQSPQVAALMLDEAGRSSRRRAMALLVALSTLSWLLIACAIAIVF
jgi:hypothetical protein